MELAQRLISTRRGTIFVAALAALLALAVAALLGPILWRWRQSRRGRSAPVGEV